MGVPAAVAAHWFGGGPRVYPHEIKQSLRLDASTSEYLTRTPASAGNRRCWTWSGWVKRSNLSGTNQVVFEAYIDTGNRSGVRFLNDRIDLFSYRSSTFDFDKRSAPLFRDPAAHYHIHVVLDTNNANAEDRAQVYVNGVRITDWSVNTPPPLGYNVSLINGTFTHAIGRGPSGHYFDGYLSEVHFIDGQALGPEHFGQFKSGIWVPKRYDGSYGVNGFYLPFSNGAAVGTDASGNGNDWTPTGIAEVNVTKDSPTNNFAVMSSVQAFPSGPSLVTVSTAGITYSAPATPGQASRMIAVSTFAVSRGKWFVQFDKLTNAKIGIAQGFDRSNSGYVGYALYSSVGRLDSDIGTISGSAPAYTPDDFLGLAFDADNGVVSFYKNNVLQGTVTMPPGIYCFVSTVYASASAFSGRVNFGQRPFHYPPPTGFSGVCSKNLPEPDSAVFPATKAFDTLLYTGDGTSNHRIRGLRFSPNFVWIKERASPANISGNFLFDTDRGVGRELITNLAREERFNSITLSAFNEDGFTVGSPTVTNENGSDFVAWNWREGAPYGFEIVTYTGTGVIGQPIPHGLGRPPAFMIVKSRDQATSWVVYHRDIGENYYLWLDSTNAMAGPNTAAWGGIAPDASNFYLGPSSYLNKAGDNVVAYLFAEIPGFSRIGSWIGSGNADGPFVHCGFRPAFLLWKRVDDVGNWNVIDARRNPTNPAVRYLHPNLANGEGVSTDDLIDLTSNGFKVRTATATTNAAAGRYVFVAFAEQTFKYVNAR